MMRRLLAALRQLLTTARPPRATRRRAVVIERLFRNPDDTRLWMVIRRPERYEVLRWDAEIGNMERCKLVFASSARAVAYARSAARAG